MLQKNPIVTITIDSNRKKGNEHSQPIPL